MAAGRGRRSRADARLDPHPLIEMRTRTAPVAALLFGSGFCALVYQIAWLREFRLIFGASTAASAAVLAIFIGGLGAGGLLLGAARRSASAPAAVLRHARSDRRAVGGAEPAAACPRPHGLPRERRHAATRPRRRATVERLVFSVLVLAVPDDRDGRHAARRGARGHARRGRAAPGRRRRSTASTRSAPSPAACVRRSSCSKSRHARDALARGRDQSARRRVVARAGSHASTRVSWPRSKRRPSSRCRQPMQTVSRRSRRRCRSSCSRPAPSASPSS